MVRPDPHLLKRLPRLEAHLDRSALGDVPADWRDQDPTATRYPMDGNDELGDCVAARIAHQIESQARRTQPYHDIVVTSTDVVAWYWDEAYRQYGPPLDTDHTPPGPGLDPVAATTHWGQIGFPGLGDNLIDGAVTFGLNDPQLLRWVGWNFRGFGVALELPADWQSTFTAPGDWAVSGAPDPSEGHMVFVGGYRASGEQLIWTWGTSKWASPQWLPTYGMFGVVELPDWWRTVPGINGPTLEKELQGWGGHPVTV